MGQKKQQDDQSNKNEAAKKDAKNEHDEKEEEDSPLIKELKEVDEKYAELEREYQKQARELQKQYTEKQKPLLEERAKKLLSADGGDEKSGTPACSGFWLTAMKNYPYLNECIREWDEPVLEYLRDIKASDLESDPKGNSTRIEFHFAENPYFTDTVLWKEVYADEENLWTGQQEIKSIKCNEVDWKPGKDITVEKKEKKVKGGGAKKAKQKGQVKEQPRDSFFRLFFRSIDSEGDEMPYVGDELEMMGEEMDDEDDIKEYLLDHDSEAAQHIKDYFIPYAVRFYTGEAEMEEEEDDDEDEEEEEDDDDDDDDSDDEPAPKKKGQQVVKKKGGGSDKPGSEKEECKQQ